MCGRSTRQIEGADLKFLIYQLSQYFSLFLFHKVSQKYKCNVQLQKITHDPTSRMVIGKYSKREKGSIAKKGMYENSGNTRGWDWVFNCGTVSELTKKSQIEPNELLFYRYVSERKRKRGSFPLICNLFSVANQSRVQFLHLVCTAAFTGIALVSTNLSEQHFLCYGCVANLRK